MLGPRITGATKLFAISVLPGFQAPPGTIGLTFCPGLDKVEAQEVFLLGRGLDAHLGRPVKDHSPLGQGTLSTEDKM